MLNKPLKRYELYVVLAAAITIAATQPAQPSRYPSIGHTIKDHHFDDVRNFERQSVSFKDFRGKWLVIDCWNQYCQGCINLFPETDSIARESHSKVAVLLVGYTGTKYTKRKPDDAHIHYLYDSLSRHQDLSMPIAYDSTFFNENDIAACPYIIIVDPTGVVRVITDRLTRPALRELLDGKKVKWEPAYRQHQPGSAYLKYHPNGD